VQAPAVGTLLEVQCEDDQWYRACVRKSKGAKAIVVFEELEDGEEVTEELDFPDDDVIVRICKPSIESGASTPATISSVSELASEVEEDSDDENDEDGKEEDSDEEIIDDSGDEVMDDSDEDSDEEDDDESDDEEIGVNESGNADESKSVTQRLKSTCEDDDVASTAASDTGCASESSWGPLDDDDENACLCVR